MRPRRGDVWLVDLGQPIGHEQGGHRPGVVVSADALNEGPAGVAIFVPLTTRSRGLPAHVEIEPGPSGLDEVSYARCEDVRSISDERFVTRLGVAPPPAMFGIARSIRYLLDL